MMKRGSLVSVILPVYNGEMYLSQAVASILKQSFRELELIVINDGSTDATCEILATIDDPRLRVLEQSNQGLVAALNRGIAAARGTFLARMDHDDISLPQRLELQIEWLNTHPEHAAVGCQFAQMDESGRVLNRSVPLPLDHQGVLRRIATGQLGVLHPTMLLRLSSLREIGGYDARVRHSEDVDLVYRLATRYRLANIDRVAYLYRITRKAVSTGLFHKQRRNERILRGAWQRYLQTGSYHLSGEEYRGIGDHMRADEDRTRCESHFHNRVGRALLRGGNWAQAGKHYLLSILNRPLQLLAYLGVARALLHLGRTSGGFPWSREMTDFSSGTGNS